MLSKVITIAQQKGGTGKTTLAVHLALAFIKYHNLKIAIIDTDPQGSLGKWFMIREEKKLSKDNLTFKTASLWGAQYESKALKKDHDIVIIDTPPKIDEIRLAKIIAILDSIIARIFFFKGDYLYINLKFYFAECLLTILCLNAFQSHNYCATKRWYWKNYTCSTFGSCFYKIP